MFMAIISFEAELQCELTKIFLPKKLPNKQKKNLHLDIIVETRVVLYSCKYIMTHGSELHGQTKKRM